MPLRSLVTQLCSAALTGELLQRTERDARLLLRGAGRISRALLASTTDHVGQQAEPTDVPVIGIGGNGR